MPPPRLSSFSLNMNWNHYGALLVIAYAILAGLFRVVVIDQADPLHCNSLMNKGRWLSRASKVWQPEGCMLHPYESKDSASCLSDRTIVFSGDSVTRKLFFQVAHLVDPTLPTGPTDDGQKHSDHHLQSANGTKLDFHWDPFLNATYVQNLLMPNASSNTLTESKRPSLLVLGTGLWYLRYSNSSGGLSAWEAEIRSLLDAIARTSPTVADTVVLLPVEEIIHSKLSPDRAATMRAPDIDAMNSDLYHRLNPSSIHPSYFFHKPAPSLPVYFPRVFNLLLDPSETDDGLHFSDEVIAVQANILLNLHCNDRLEKRVPFDKTCCRSYPSPSLIQSMVLGLIILWGPFTWLTSIPADLPEWSSPPAIAKKIPSLVFSTVAALVYVADRTWLWEKEQKYFDPWLFVGLTLASIAVGLATVKRSDNDLGFLNREQTDEWKGWMQIAILIYHYTGASKISGIYNPIRVLVASYLFMTGYGHTTFYLRKADFGLERVIQVIIRLNTLTLLLTYIMNTDYIFYYFTPLVSFWYVIIYTTMAIGARHNERTIFLLGKIIISSIIVTYFMREQWLVESLFDLLERVFKIKWSSREWSFRVTLDLWIVYAGVLTSVVVAKCREYRLTDHPQWPLVLKLAVLFSLLVFLWFFAFELLEESKFAYNLWHPYVSFLPVLSFVILRNANSVLRSASSRAFAFIGRCSLEAFILQYHLWLAADSKGLLVTIPGVRWRPVNFVVITIIFIYACNEVARATSELTIRICRSASNQAQLPVPVTSTSIPDSIRLEGREGSANEGIPLVDSRKSTDDEELPPEPDTPIRPLGWIGRSAGYAQGNWIGGLKTRMTIIFIGIWLINLLYS